MRNIYSIYYILGLAAVTWLVAIVVAGLIYHWLEPFLKVPHRSTSWGKGRRPKVVSA